MALKNLGLNVCPITKVADEDKDLLNELVRSKIRIFCGKRRKRTIFENIHPENLDSSWSSYERGYPYGNFKISFKKIKDILGYTKIFEKS